MTPEERYEKMDQKIEFILHQQSQFYSDLRRVDAQIEQNQAMILRLGDRMDQLGDRMDQLGERMEQLGNFVEQMGNYMVRSTDNLTRELAQRDAEWREEMRAWRKGDSSRNP